MWVHIIITVSLISSREIFDDLAIENLNKAIEQNQSMLTRITTAGLLTTLKVK